jgi:hypothetical protein
VVESHTLMWETTSPFVPAQLDHTGSVVVMAFEPADAADHVSAGRVVTELALAVPAEPGSPVCSLTAVTAPAAKLVLDSVSRSLFARLVV